MIFGYVPPQETFEFTEEESTHIREVVDKIKHRYGFNLKESVLFALSLAEKELKLEEEALRGMGKKIS